jgi:hypothetical protein
MRQRHKRRTALGEGRLSIKSGSTGEEETRAGVLRLRGSHFKQAGGHRSSPHPNESEVPEPASGEQQAAPGGLDPRIAEKFRWEADRIRALAKDLVGHARSKLTNVVEIGRVLRFVKANMAHGGWLAWLSSEIDISQRAARNFMTVSAAFEARSATVADLERLQDNFALAAAYRLAPWPDLFAAAAARPSTAGASPSAMPRR